MGEESPCLQPQKGLPAPLRTGDTPVTPPLTRHPECHPGLVPGSPFLTRMSSRPCAGITGSNQDVTPDLFRGHRFLPAPFFLVCLLRGRIYTLTHSLRSSVRFVNPSLSAKKHERDSRMGTLIARKCKNRVLRKPCDY